MLARAMTRLERRRWFRRVFWEIEREGAQLRIRSGRVGEPGSVQLETLADEYAAKVRRERLVNRQLGAGWLLAEGSLRYEPDFLDFEQLIACCSFSAQEWTTTEFGARQALRGPDPDYLMPPGSLARNPALEAQVIASDDDADWRVYADWLASQGDPLGGHINACMDGSEQPELAAELRPLWLGEAFCARIAECARACYAFEWRRGFIHRAWVSVGWDLGRDLPELLAPLLDSPAARFLRELQIGLAEGEDINRYDELARFFRSRPPLPSIEQLFVGAFAYPSQTEISWTEVGDISGLPACFPRLRAYGVRGSLVELGALEHEHIERLVLESGGLNLDAVQSVMGAKLPKLRELELWLGDEGYGAEANIRDLEPLFAGRFEGLEVLGLRNCEFSDAIVEALIHSPLLPRLRTLDLSMGTLRTPGALLLVEHSARFAHLERLNLDENFLLPEQIELLRERLPMASCEQQDQPYTSPDHAPHYYVSVGE